MKSWKKKQKQAAKLIKKWRLEDLNMKSGLYANRDTLQMFYVFAIREFAMVTMLSNGKEISALFEVSYLLKTGDNNFYVGEV